LGSGLCEAWKFPQSFSYVTGHHHDPMELPESNRTLTSIVYVADRLAGLADYGFRGDLQSLDINSDALDEIQLTEEKLTVIKNNLPQAFEEIETMFS